VYTAITEVPRPLYYQNLIKTLTYDGDPAETRISGIFGSPGKALAEQNQPLLRTVVFEKKLSLSLGLANFVRHPSPRAFPGYAARQTLLCRFEPNSMRE
jgi:hypothetical protein